ncbi:MAG: response regulator [Gammaproteobacteria bacterium]|nr:response regulator [Gammaproteobacteria bacterium]MCW8909898.1 response regulator [Gammaproteobacteria bacterium]MCW9004190.1 response regulator [Gammaproteobacteria bacterium]MCW9055315.1 response regulator [Gammaproteobacteria bacterium]
MVEELPKHSIIVADDDQDILSVLSLMLKEADYDVRTVTNGQQAIDSAKENTPDLFLLDVHMQGMDGYQACEAIKADESLASIPVMFISGLTDPFNKIKGYQLGAVDYINKPFSLPEVLRRVKTHLDLGNKVRELEMMNAAMISREMRVIELKEEVNQLSLELGRDAPYPVVWEEQ